MLSETRKTLLALLVVLAGLAAFFYKSVFMGKPIAKLGLLPNIDAMFNPQLKKAILDFSDPSGYLIFFPNGHFEDSFWARLVQPLWNPLVACGYPLVGDPQSLIFSPAHLLRLFSTPELYNLGLLIEIALGGIGMILLCRFYKMSVIASIFSALAYVLSPRILVQIDIGGNECFFPWIFLAFAWLAAEHGSSFRPGSAGVPPASTPDLSEEADKNGQAKSVQDARAPREKDSLDSSILKAALVGVACALLAFSAHPETVFFAVLFAAILCFFSIAVARVLPSMPINQRISQLFKDGLKAIGLLLVTALVSLCVASPLVMPFVEFMKQSYIYKDELGTALTFSGYGDFLAGFYAGQGKEAFFIGSVAALLVPLVLLDKSKIALAVACSLLVGFIICLPQGYMQHLLSQKPINYINTYYGTPEILLLLSLLAGMAIDLLQTAPRLPRLFILFVSLLVAVIYPIQLQQTQLGTTDLAHVWKTSRNLLTATSLFAFFAFFVCLLTSAKPKALKLLAALGLISLNFASMALIGRNVLPVNPPFSLKPPAPVQYLQELGGRSLTTGSNFFLPNVNADFAVEDFRCFSPLLPSRYLQFLKACGAQVYNLYFYVMPDRCSALLDLASVKYVCTRSAISADEPSRGEAMPSAGVTRLFPGLRLTRLAAFFDTENSQLDAELTLKVHDNCNYRYSIEYLLFDKTGKQLWSTRELILSPASQKNHLDTNRISAPIPRNARLPLSFCLRVKDTWISQVVKPDDVAPHVADAFRLCDVEYSDGPQSGDSGADEAIAGPPACFAGTPPHFKLLKEFGENGCRVYENMQALPGAYLVKSARHFKRADKAAVWEQLNSSYFDPRSEVLIEDEDDTSHLRVFEAATDLRSRAVAKLKDANLKRPDCNTVLIDCDAEGDAYLVLTDAYYPGWKCFVDGNETEVFAANYLFRCVKLSNGHHQVKFTFAPASYYNSLILSLLMVFCIGLWAFLRRKELFSKNQTAKS